MDPLEILKLVILGAFCLYLVKAIIVFQWNLKKTKAFFSFGLNTCAFDLNHLKISNKTSSSSHKFSSSS